MKLHNVDPELRLRAALVPPLPLHGDRGRRAVRVLDRLRGPGKPVAGVAVRQLSLGRGLRLYTPLAGGPGGALLWIHGGGFVMGTASQDHAFCAVTARDVGIVVVARGYRLAPENAFPAALDDVTYAWQWLQQSAGALGADPARIAIGGQSAGGGLAACLVQSIHDAGGVQPAAQWLFCPMLDDRTAARGELDRVRHRIWNNSLNRTGWCAYLGTGPGGSALPEYAVAARRTDLHGLPPAWIGVGDIDLFCEEDRDYARRLRDAGVECAFDLVRGAPHGFESMAPKAAVSQRYLQRSRAWLGAQLNGPARFPADEPA